MKNRVPYKKKLQLNYRDAILLLLACLTSGVSKKGNLESMAVSSFEGSSTSSVELEATDKLIFSISFGDIFCGVIGLVVC